MYIAASLQISWDYLTTWPLRLWLPWFELQFWLPEDTPHCTITNLMKFCLRTVGGIILINLQDTHASHLKDYTNQLSGDFIESSRAVNTSGNQNIAPRRHTLTPLWTRLFKVISKHSKNLRNFQNLTLSSRFLASFPISSWELKYSWVHACIWK